jgi:hypothetical protein
MKERRLGTCRDVTRSSEGERDGPGRPGIAARDKLQKLQRALYCKAKAEPKYRFYSLYGELSRKDLLDRAMQAVAENDGDAGVDGQRCEDYKESQGAWDKWRDALIEEVSSRSYRASAVRRVYIRKDGSDKLRPLGIPTVKDRVLQKAVAMLLEPIWEADSHPQSFAWQPGVRRSVEKLCKELYLESRMRENRPYGSMRGRRGRNSPLSRPTLLNESLRHLASLLGGKILNGAKLRLRFYPPARSANLVQIFVQPGRLFRLQSASSEIVAAKACNWIDNHRHRLCSHRHRLLRQPARIHHHKRRRYMN